MADCGNNRVQHLSTNGQFLDRFGTAGTGNGQFSCPVDIAIASNGDLLVLDRGNRRVQQVRRDGTFVRAWPTGTVAPGNVTGIDVDDAGNIYVADAQESTYNCYTDHHGDQICEEVVPPDNNRVRQFDAEGNPSGVWARGARRNALWITSDGVAFVSSHDGVTPHSLDGSPLAGRLEGIPQSSDIAVDRFGHIWTVSRVGGAAGVAEHTAGGHRLAFYPIRDASGLTVDRDNVYVTRGGISVTGRAIVKLAIGDPGAEVRLTSQESRVGAGQPIHYRLTAENTGDTVLRRARLTHELATTCEGFAEALSPGETLAANCTYTPTAADTGVLTATARLTSDDGPTTTSAPLSVTVDGTSIVGTISEDGTGAPIASAFVVALRSDTLALAQGTTTDAQGRYRLNVPAGDYFLQLADPSGSHTFEWYDDEPSPSSFSALTHVVVAADQQVTADASLAPTRGRIAGRVTNETSGNGIAQAWVIALRNGRPVGRGTTHGTGHYTLSGLRPGDHTAVILDRTGAHQPEFHANSPVPAGATSIPVGTGSTSTVDAALAGASRGPIIGTIKGTVTADGGGELGDMVVLALRTSDLGFVQATTTNELGEYTLEVPAGSFYLQFADTGGAYAFEWYEDEPAPASFGALTPVSAGATADASLARAAGALAGAVTASGSGYPLSGVWVVATGPGGTVGTITAANGAYYLPTSAGNHTVVFLDPTNRHAHEFHEDRPGPDGATPVAVGTSVAFVNAALDATPP